MIVVAPDPETVYAVRDRLVAALDLRAPRAAAQPTAATVATSAVDEPGASHNALEGTVHAGGFWNVVVAPARRFLAWLLR